MDLLALAKTVGGGSAVPLALMFSLYTPKGELDTLRYQYEAHEGVYIRHVAEASRPFIFDTIERAQAEDPASEYHRSLCRTLEQAIAELCAYSRDDAICVDRNAHLARAGCR